jgi:DNA-binding NarL/FixJ family response regulator
MLSNNRPGTTRTSALYPPFERKLREKGSQNIVNSPASVPGKEQRQVLLATKEPELRWALRTALSQEEGLIVVGEVASLQGLLSLARTIQPDLILMDWELPGHPVEAALAALQLQGLEARLVVIGREPQAREAALAAGADAFLNAEEPASRFLQALKGLTRR